MSTGQAPASSQSRISVIDAIRGLAVFGILLANIQSWSGYKFIPITQIEKLPLFEWDSLCNTLNLWLVDGKFYAIFSILFGVGFGIQYVKNRERQAPFVKTYRRRLSFLLMLGVLHALLWSGDILTLYALLAFVLVLLRNLSDRQVLAVSVMLFLSFLVAQSAMMMFGVEAVTIVPRAHKNYSDMAPETIINGFGNGGWVDVFRVNMHNLYWRWIDFFPNGRISRILALFLLGFYLARTDYFREAVYQRWRVPVYLALGLGCTALGSVLGGNIVDWSQNTVDLFEKLMIVAGQVILALAYMSMLAISFRTQWGRRILNPLTLIGRTAFTNYLAQSVIGITIYYGIGFGLFGTMGFAQIWGVALAIFAGQVLMSGLWLRAFRQGPVEWLWRCLTQGEWQSNIRTDPAPPAAPL